MVRIPRLPHPPSPPSSLTPHPTVLSHPTPHPPISPHSFVDIPLRLCDVHNTVNKRLRKPEFDCAHLDETYDCGCGDDPVTPTDPVKADARGVVKEDAREVEGAGARGAVGGDVRDADRAPADPMDLERDPTKDDVTGAEMIRGGR